MQQVISREFLLEVAKGNVYGNSDVSKFGRNDSVPNGSWAFVRPLGAHTFLTAATTVRVKAGGSADDAAAGSGARTVVVEGLDETGATASATLTLAGASASASSSVTFLRVFRAYVATCGAYHDANAANITIEATGGGDLIQIPIGEGSTFYAGYSIPLGYTGFMLEAEFTVNSTKSADFRLFKREGILEVAAPYKSRRVLRHWTGIESSMPYSPKAPIAFPELTDVWFEVQGNATGTKVSVNFDLLLVKTDILNR